MPDKSRFPPDRTSIRLSFQFSFVYASLSAIVFAMTYFFTKYEIREWVRLEMSGAAATLEAIYQAEGPEALIRSVNNLADASFENAQIYQLRASDDTVVSGNIPVELDGDLPDRVPVEAVHLYGRVNEELTGYWMRVDQIGPYELIQGSSDHVFAEIQEALGYALIAGVLFVMTLGLIVGTRVGRITEQRITDISASLSDFSGGKLDARVPTAKGRQDDFARVSVSINLMLEEIRRLLESQKQISNDIAHDMRTPLQRLRQRLETMESSTSVSPEDVTTSLKQTEEIIGTFNALLRIAQIEAADKRAKFEKLDITGVVRNVTELFEPFAEDKGIELCTQICDGKALVFGDEDLLTQLLSNLIENAIKHSPLGKHIEVSTHSSSINTLVRVADDGPGIDPGDHERIFQRFFRGEKSRSSPGNGLGLTLARAIADLHGASLSVSNSNPGAVFEIRFPNVSS